MLDATTQEPLAADDGGEQHQDADHRDPADAVGERAAGGRRRRRQTDDGPAAGAGGREAEGPGGAAERGHLDDAAAARGQRPQERVVELRRGPCLPDVEVRQDRGREAVGVRLAVPVEVGEVVQPQLDPRA